ncbi:MAG: zinc-ribbon domain-containing protein [Deltaproteobacteria bacterium]|nr:zinc-ribbon domain-containing protein [Deltaproteobacteria bacterium]
MIIICEECGTKYRIDPSKIKGKDIKTKCKACSHLIVVKKPGSAPEKKPQDDGKIAIMPPEPEPESAPEPEPESAPEPEPEPESEPESPVETKPPASPKLEKPAKKPRRPQYSRTKKFRFGLTAKLFSMMIIVSLVPLSMFWGITLKQTIERMRNDTVRAINQVSISMSKQIDEWLDKNVRMQKTFANLDDMISMDRFLQEPLLETIRQVYPWVYSSYSIDLNGTNVARNDDALFRDYSDSQYYKDIIAGKAVAWQVLLDESTKQPALILAVPIKNGNKTVGLLASAMPKKERSLLIKMRCTFANRRISTRIR